jgi:hypothetical protein
MSKLIKVRDTPQDIHVIIKSFEKYALGDIRYIKCKPIAAFILSMCFIDQIASFRYKLLRDPNKRPEDFIEQYMNEYHGLDLYDFTRHTLIHHYSSQNKFDIDNRYYPNEAVHKTEKIIYINTNVFIERLETAFEEVKSHFLDTASDAYQNALIRSMYHPVLVDADN